MTDQEKDRFIVEKTGGCWHRDFYEVQPFVEYNQDQVMACGICDMPEPTSNPDFRSPAGRIELLKIMMAREDWHAGFSNYIGVWPELSYGYRVFHIDSEYMTDDTGKFRDAVYEWLKEKDHDRP